jgi:hypothetical protein
MTTDPTEEVIALLAQAEAAHGTYEATELNGVYDQEWAHWYAAYAVEHDIGGLIGHAVATDELARLLARSFDEFQQTEPKASESWAAYTARRITAEL